MKNNPVNIAFGAMLASARKGAGITQEELGRRVGVVRTTIANMEAGRQSVSLPLLFRIASALKSDPKALVPSLDTDSPGETGQKEKMDGEWTQRVIENPGKKQK